jgi:ketosteroid isomerase-like protein
MHSANPVEVVLEFERLVNSRNVDAITGLLTEDSVFIDSLGQSIHGAGNLRAAWSGYFKMVPDYSISHSEIFSNGDTVAMFGTAQGTFARGAEMKKEDFWKTPASWRAVVKGGKIAVWQVFADNEPIRAIMRKYQ